MQPMDLACFVAESEEISSLQMSFSRLEGVNSKMQVCNSFKRASEMFVKLRSKLVCIFGDLYWKEIDNFDPLDCITFIDGFETLQDIGDFMAKELSKKLPLNRPQWRVFAILDFKGSTIIMIKEHHSLGDGASNICLNMSLSKSYHP